MSVCRLVPNKRVDLIIKAFNKLGYPLVVVGDGPEMLKIRKLANQNIKLLGYQDDISIKKLMERCRAFVYAGVEDFGLTPVEAMSAGSPVIALGKGGLLDTVNCITQKNDFKTGLLFKEQTSQSIYDSVSWFEEGRVWEKFSPDLINQWARKFSKENFYLNFKNFLDNACNDFY